MNLESMFSATTGAASMTFLIEAATKGTLLLAGAALLALALRRASAAHRHLVWACALAALVALPALLAAIPALPVSVPTPAWIAPAPAPAPAESEAASPSPEPPREASTEMPQPSQTVPQATSPTRDGAPGPARVQPPPRWTWPVALVALWALGALSVLATFVAGHLLLRVLLSGARPVRDDAWHALAREAAEALRLTVPFALLESPAVQVPVAVGLLRPRVLLPAAAADWPAERRRAVLLHELAHVQRHDCLTQAIAQLACALFWFHPAAWWAASRLRAEREHACDDRVLAARTRATEYADQLLDMVRSLRASRLAALGAVAFARPSNLEGRLLAVLDPRRDRRAVGRNIVAWAATGAFLLLLPFAAIEPGPASAARGDWANASGRNPTDPKSLRPSRVVTVPTDGRSLEQRAEWARDEAGRAGERVWWIGWTIETTETMKGNLLSDSEGIRLHILGQRGLHTLADEIAGREQGTSEDERAFSRNEEGRKPTALLVRVGAGGPDRVRIQSLALPVEFAGEPLYWLEPVADEQGFRWLREAADRSREPRLRAKLVEGIGFLGSSEVVTPYLKALLESAEPEKVRIAAAEGLSRHPSPAVTRLLAGHARTDRSSRVRRAAVEGLGHAQTPEALQELLAIARAAEGHPDTRRTALDALGEKVSDRAPDTDVPDDGKAGEHREKAEKAKEWKRESFDASEKSQDATDAGLPDGPSQPMSGAELDVQRQAIESLGRYPEEQSLLRLKRIAETSPSTDLRGQAVESIGRIGTPGALSIVEQIAWKNRHAGARERAVETLGRKFPAEQALEKLSVIARTHPSKGTRRMAVEALGRLDTPAALQALERILEGNGDPEAQRQAAESLGRRDEAGVEDRLIRIARSDRPVGVRRQAIESLGRRKGERTADLLLEIARADLPGEVQRQAAESLGRLDDPRVKEMLLDLARRHPSREVGRQAVESLGRLESDVMAELAEIARSHPSGDVRRQAVESMTRRDPDRALPFLEEILRQPGKKDGT